MRPNSFPGGVAAMPHYIALIHKDADSCYGVSFPDWPGVFTAGETIDEAMQQAAEVLGFAAEDWESRDGTREFQSLAPSTNCAPMQGFTRTQLMP
jgi:predicted RNase H-like HicB family nuclease